MDSKLLIVEDHADTAEAMAILLRKAGYGVAVAGSCSDALKVAAAEKPKVVVCDIGLPDGDGCELLSELKKKHGVAGIAVSGYAVDRDRKRCMEAGFTDFLIKPFTIEQLKEAIAGAMRSANTRFPPSDDKL